MDLTIIIPAYNEEENILNIYNSVKSVVKKLKKKHEIIFIDDGSIDDTFSEIKKLASKDSTIRATKFIKNRGKSDALNYGFMQSKGDIVITLDADLQDDPEEIPNFVDKINEGYDLVSGWKHNRKDPISKRWPSKIFNYLTSAITGLRLHDFNCGFKAYKKKVVKNITIYGELHRYIPAIAYWKGFKVAEIKVNHKKRIFGKSKFGAGRIYRGFFDLLTVKFLSRFMKKPLHFFGSLGFFSIFIGILIGIHLSYLRFVLDEKIGDRPLLMLSVLLLVIGVQFISMGLLGEMISRMSKEEDYIILNKI